MQDCVSVPERKMHRTDIGSSWDAVSICKKEIRRSVVEREEREKRILEYLRTSRTPVSGTALAKNMQVSRQVIVQDIAILRANGENILSTNNGYLLQKEQERNSRVFKVYHSDEQTEEELNLFVDLGGLVEDVFVYHKVYGVVRAGLHLKSRKDVREYMEKLKEGKSSLLKNVTSGYHYHTVEADDKRTLDLIQEELGKKGFLAALQDYEPVDFWKEG